MNFPSFEQATELLHNTILFTQKGQSATRKLCLDLKYALDIEANFRIHKAHDTNYTYAIYTDKKLSIAKRKAAYHFLLGCSIAYHNSRPGA